MSFAAEDRLLLLCSRSARSETQTATARGLLESSLDWGYIVESSVRHGVAPLLHHGLTQLLDGGGGDGPVPAPALAELARLRAASAERNSRLYAVVGDVMEALAAGGVRAMGLKDMSLALELYPEPGLRPIGDLDILISRDDYAAAARTLPELGFDPLPRADVPYVRKYAVGQHFRRLQDDLWIDLQWNVMQREWDVHGDSVRTFDVESMWRGARTLTVVSGERLYDLRAPSLEDMLYHLCLHAEGHRYSELILLCDIAELLEARSDEINWAAIVDIARRHEATPSVGGALELVERVLGVGAPAEARRALGSHAFTAGVHEAVFGNLTSLHFSLEDIRRAAAPPPELMQRLEALVRTQAAMARALYEEIDSLAADVLAEGAELIALDGTDPPRLFPDEALPPFGDLQLLILTQDRDRFLEICQRRGLAADGSSDRLLKRLPVRSSDPLVRATPVTVAVELDMAADDPLLLTSPSYSNRDAALVSLRRRLDRRRSSRPEPDALIKVAAVPRDELMLRLLAKTGAEQHTVCFSLVTVLDFLGRSSAPISLERVAAAAARLGVVPSAARGLQLIDQVAPVAEWCGDPEAAAALDEAPQRALEWARYDAASLERYTLLRSGYLLLLCLLAGQGWRERVQLLRSTVSARGGTRPGIAAFARATRDALLQLGRRRRVTTRELAYWTRVPDTGSSPGTPRVERVAGPEGAVTPPGR